jgi:hypothetical protein
MPFVQRGDLLRWDVSLMALDPESAKRTTLAVQAAILLALLMVSCRRPPRAADARVWGWLQGSAIAAGMALLSPMSSKPHFCVLLAGLGVGWALALGRCKDAVLIALLSAVGALGWLTEKDLVGRPFGNEMQGRGSYTLAALAVIGMALWVQARWRKFATPAQPARRPTFRQAA